MLHFDPHSQLARRLKPFMIYFGIFLALLAVFVHYAKGWREEQGSDEKIKTTFRLKGIQAALASRHFTRGKYPTDEEGGLKTMFQVPGKDGKIRYPVIFVDFEKNPPTLDGWKQQILYRCPGVHNKDGYDLWSIGEDGKDGTDDDITNW